MAQLWPILFCLQTIMLPLIVDERDAAVGSILAAHQGSGATSYALSLVAFDFPSMSPSAQVITCRS